MTTLPIGRYTNSDNAAGDDLYFVSTPEGFCKIGRTGNIVKRLATLQNASAQPLRAELVLPGMGWQERVWHSAFRHLRAKGERFQCSPELGRAINAAEQGEEWIASLTSPRDGMTDYQWRDHIADMEEAALPELAPA